jgi:hypothetical protein
MTMTEILDDMYNIPSVGLCDQVLILNGNLKSAPMPNVTMTQVSPKDMTLLFNTDRYTCIKFKGKTETCSYAFYCRNHVDKTQYTIRETFMIKFDSNEKLDSIADVSCVPRQVLDEFELFINNTSN